MKEKIFEILHNRKRMPGERFSDIEGKIENFVNQEVERRIAEMMPSEEDFQNAESRYEDEQNEDKLRFDTEYCYRDYMNGWEDCRSRLTNPGVNDSQKTEGGKR